MTTLRMRGKIISTEFNIGVFMKSLIFSGLSILICTPAVADWQPENMPTDDQLANWSLEVGESNFDDSPFARISLNAKEQVTCSGHDATPSLKVMCYEGEISAYLFVHEQCKFWDNLTNTMLEYRVDDNPMQSSPFGSGLNNEANGLWGTENSRSFIQQLETGSTLIGRFLGGMDEAMSVEFDLTGIDNALPVVLEACPSATTSSTEQTKGSTTNPNQTQVNNGDEFENPTCGGYRTASLAAESNGIDSLGAMMEMTFYAGFISGFLKANNVAVEDQTIQSRAETLCEGLPDNEPLESAIRVIMN